MRTNNILWLVVIVVAVALIPSLSYGYYSVMRWVVCASCGWLALMSYRNGHEQWAWCWGVIAGIYNPIFPVHANREVWSVVNVATIALAAWYGFKVMGLNKGKGNGGET